MKLLGTPTSPYVRKVQLMLLEKGIPHEYLVDAPRDPGSLAARANPLARIPALVLDDETCVFDSPVIAEYVDTLNDDPILIPRTDALARMHVKRWEALADGIMDSAFTVRSERLRPEEKQDADTIERHNQAISRALEFAGAQLGNAEWTHGETLSLGDLALFAALVYLDLRQAERDWRSLYPNLKALFERIAARPSAQTSLAGQ